MGIKKVKKLQLLPFTVYVFRDYNVYYGIGRAKTKGIDVEFAYGWSIEPDPKSKENSKIFQEKRAKRNVITRVSNSLNAVYLYKDKVFDEDGNISWEKYSECEKEAARKDNEKSKIIIPLDKHHGLHTFKIIELSFETAQQQGLI